MILVVVGRITPPPADPKRPIQNPPLARTPNAQQPET